LLALGEFRDDGDQVVATPLDHALLQGRQLDRVLVRVHLRAQVPSVLIQIRNYLLFQLIYLTYLLVCQVVKADRGALPSASDFAPGISQEGHSEVADSIFLHETIDFSGKCELPILNELLRVLNLALLLGSPLVPLLILREGHLERVVVIRIVSQPLIMVQLPVEGSDLGLGSGAEVLLVAPIDRDVLGERDVVLVLSEVVEDPFQVVPVQQLKLLPLNVHRLNSRSLA